MSDIFSLKYPDDIKLRTNNLSPELNFKPVTLAYLQWPVYRLRENGGDLVVMDFHFTTSQNLHQRILAEKQYVRLKFIICSH